MGTGGCDYFVELWIEWRVELCVDEKICIKLAFELQCLGLYVRGYAEVGKENAQNISKRMNDAYFCLIRSSMSAHQA